MSQDTPDNIPEFTLQTDTPQTTPKWPVVDFETLEWTHNRLQAYISDFHAMASAALASPPTVPASSIEELQALLNAMPPDVGQHFLNELRMGYNTTAEDRDIESEVAILPVFKILKTIRKKLEKVPNFVWQPPAWEDMKKDPKALYNLYLAYNEASKNAQLEACHYESSKATIRQTSKPDSFRTFQKTFIKEHEDLGRERLPGWWGGYDIDLLSYSIRSDSMAATMLRTLKKVPEKIMHKQAGIN